MVRSSFLSLLLREVLPGALAAPGPVYSVPVLVGSVFQATQYSTHSRLARYSGVPINKRILFANSRLLIIQISLPLPPMVGAGLRLTHVISRA